MTVSASDSATKRASCPSSYTSPSTGTAPICFSCGVRSAERVSATTLCPAFTSNGTRQRPIAPVPPAMKRFISALAAQVFHEKDADRLEAAAVDLAGAVAGEGFEVLGGGVALVTVEAVVRVALVQARHLGVAGGLGEDRGGRDHLVGGVAV